MKKHQDFAFKLDREKKILQNANRLRQILDRDNVP